MQTLELDLTKRYTYADYLTWFDNVRRELIDGFINLMSPAPSRFHQYVSKRIFNRLENYLYKKPCEAYYAPFDVRFPKNKSENNNTNIFDVVQPDICIICDKSKLDDKGCIGAPDMIVEIVSLSNTKHDVKTKFNLYQQNGVREYWIVFPYDKMVQVFLLDENGKYQHQANYTEEDKVKVNIFEDLYIDLQDVFED